ncbi:MAG TPA: recombinase family protein [Desulfosporosinus sp.]|nr:recombinase family protein [Desulfosporosinus sp.]
MSQIVAVYRRVSTDRQDTASQAIEIDKYVADKHKNDIIEVYEDHGMSGAKDNRPAFQRLLRDCESGKISTVIVFKLDRLSRVTSTCIKTALKFDEWGVKFVAVTQPMFSHGTPFRHAMVAIFGELAQMERQNHIDRVNAGIEAARKKGTKFGAPSKVSQEINDLILSMKLKGLSVRKIAAQCAVSKSTVQRVLTLSA